MRLILAALLLLLPRCAPEARPRELPSIRVFAAASLTDALTEIAGTYERQAGSRIVFNFGASSTLARQLENGAPADVFLSADEAKMDSLQRKGLIDASTRASVLSNTLVVVSNEPVAGARDLIGRTLALAEPSAVPAGIYAKAWLERQQVWDQVAPNVVPTENVRAALAAVERGNAAAAIVYATDARIAKQVRVAYAVPRAEGPEISYPFAAVANAPPAARQFLGHLRSKAALDVFARHGFLIQ